MKETNQGKKSVFLYYVIYIVSIFCSFINLWKVNRAYLWYLNTKCEIIDKEILLHESWVHVPCPRQEACHQSLPWGSSPIWLSPAGAFLAVTDCWRTERWLYHLDVPERPSFGSSSWYLSLASFRLGLPSCASLSHSFWMRQERIVRAEALACPVPHPNIQVQLRLWWQLPSLHCI